MQAQLVTMPDTQAGQIADAIYKIEGGANTKFPYGIKSVKTSNPRQVCLNTIKNNYIRWQKAGSKQNYLDFLANIYCPPSADKQGNQNWIKNIHAMIK
jgi:hypothetical protein